MEEPRREQEQYQHYNNHTNITHFGRWSYGSLPGTEEELRCEPIKLEQCSIYKNYESTGAISAIFINKDRAYGNFAIKLNEQCSIYKNYESTGSISDIFITKPNQD